MKGCPLWKPGREFVPMSFFWLSLSQPPLNFELFFLTTHKKVQQLRSDVVTMEIKELLLSSGM